MTDSAMYALAAFELPLTEVPPGFGWDDRSSSETCTEETADACVIARDTFRGTPCCVVCGEIVSNVCRIIAETKYSGPWDDLRRRGWLPAWVNENAEDEPRNAIHLCLNHKVHFEMYVCFIRYVPSERKFIFVNYVDNYTNEKYHGKAVALDIDDEYAPFPALFLLHEQRVRGFQPFSEPSPLLPKEHGRPFASKHARLFATKHTSLFRREGPPRRFYQDKTNKPPPVYTSSGLPGKKGSLALNNDVIANILAASRETASWQSAVVENTSWDGTAEENVKKYQDITDGNVQ